MEPCLPGSRLRVMPRALGHAALEAAVASEVCADPKERARDALLGEATGRWHSDHPEIHCLPEREARALRFVGLVHGHNRLDNRKEPLELVWNTLRQWRLEITADENAGERVRVIDGNRYYRKAVGSALRHEARDQGIQVARGVSKGRHHWLARETLAQNRDDGIAELFGCDRVH